MRCERDENGNIIDPVTTEVIPPGRVFVLTENGVNFCFDIETLQEIVATQDIPKNPYTNTPFTDEVLKRLTTGPPRVSVSNLLNAIYQDDFDKFVQTASQIRNLNAAYDNNTPLLAALSQGDFRMVQYLLQHGADPNFGIYDSEYESPRTMYPLFRTTNLPLLRLLIANGANINIRDSLGNNVLEHHLPPDFYRYDQTLAPLLDFYLQNGIEVTGNTFDKIDPQNIPSLEAALIRNNRPIPVFTTDPMQRLENLIRSGYTPPIREIVRQEDIDAGVDTGPSGQSFLRTALQYQPNNIDLLRELVPHATITQEDIDFATSPIAKQFLRERRNQENRLVLTRAIERGDLDQVDRLLAQGVQVEERHTNNEDEEEEDEESRLEDPVSNAIADGHFDVALYLIQIANLSQSILIRSLIALAESRENPDDIDRLVQLILSKGIDPTVALVTYFDEQDENLRDDSNSTINQVAKRLIGYGADPNTMEERPLRAAILADDYDFAKQLLENGAKIDKSVIETFFDKDDMKWLDLALSYGLDINAYDGAILIYTAMYNPSRIRDILARGATVGLNLALDAALRRGGDVESIRPLVEAGAVPTQAQIGNVLRYSYNTEINEYLIQRFPALARAAQAQIDSSNRRSRGISSKLSSGRYILGDT